MNKAEKMKKLALSMKKRFKVYGSFSDKKAYRYCLDRIKTASKEAELKVTIRIDETDYIGTLDINNVLKMLKQDGFRVLLSPWYPELEEDDDFIGDWKLEVSWE